MELDSDVTGVSEYQICQNLTDYENTGGLASKSEENPASEH